MKTAVGNPDDFHKKNPEENFKRTLPGGDYKSGPKTVHSPHQNSSYSYTPRKKSKPVVNPSYPDKPVKEPGLKPMRPSRGRNFYTATQNSKGQPKHGM